MTVYSILVTAYSKPCGLESCSGAWLINLIWRNGQFGHTWRIPHIVPVLFMPPSSFKEHHTLPFEGGSACKGVDAKSLVKAWQVDDVETIVFGPHRKKSCRLALLSC